MKLFYFQTYLLFLFTTILRAQDAPVTVAPDVASFDTVVPVPVSVLGFKDITSFALRLDYDPLVINAISVTSGPGTSGHLTANLDTPGSVILGWYAYPPVTLPDTGILLTIGFSRMKIGGSFLKWVDDGYSCYYSDSNSVILNDMPDSLFYKDGSVTFRAMAPITVAPIIKAHPDELIDVPVKVYGFSGVGEAQLLLLYDPLVIRYQSLINGAGFPGWTATDSVGGQVMIRGMADTNGYGVSLPDSSVLFTLRFRYYGGSTGLNWYPSDNGCKYLGSPPDYPELIDTPWSDHYINGQVSPALGMNDPEQGLWKFQVTPDPFIDKVSISFYLGEECEVSFSVLAVTGRVMLADPWSGMCQGAHQVEIPTTEWTAGSYYFRVCVKKKGEVSSGIISALCIK